MDAVYNMDVGVAKELGKHLDVCTLCNGDLFSAVLHVTNRGGRGYAREIMLIGLVPVCFVCAEGYVCCFSHRICMEMTLYRAMFCPGRRC